MTRRNIHCLHMTIKSICVHTAIEDIYVHCVFVGREDFRGIRIIFESRIYVAQDVSERRKRGVVIGFLGQERPPFQHFHVDTNFMRVCFIQVDEC